MRGLWLYRLALVLVVLSCVAGCQWLDQAVPEGVTEDRFFTTAENFSAAMDAVYGELGWEETWGRDFFYDETASDDAVVAKSWNAYRNAMSSLKVTSLTGGSLGDQWQAMYWMMARANRLIWYGLKQDGDPVIFERVGEAYFIRALTHFIIAFRYGREDNGVPYIRYEEYDDIAEAGFAFPEQQPTVMDNYRLILEDLQEAESRLPYFQETKSQDWGRATKDAAIALQVKVLAYWAGYDEAKWSEIPHLVDRLASECGRALQPEFADLFKIENEWGCEYIFSINSHGENQAGSLFPGILLEDKGWTKYNGWGSIKPTLNLWAEYEDADKRRPVTLLAYGDEFTYFGEKMKYYSTSGLETGFQFAKYMEPFSYLGKEGNNGKISTDGNRPCTDLNVPILRYGEMLLFKAEALAEMGDAAGAGAVLSEIAERAGLGANKYPTATMEDVMHERRLELAGEFTGRIYDLKRWARKYPSALERIKQPKYGLKHVERDNPDSPVDELERVEGEVEVKTITLYGKTWKGALVLTDEKEYDPDVQCALPYSDDEIVRSKGRYKQNKGY